MNFIMNVSDGVDAGPLWETFQSPTETSEMFITSYEECWQTEQFGQSVSCFFLKGLFSHIQQGIFCLCVCARAFIFF